MKADIVEVDSQVLGRNVLAIGDYDPGQDFAVFERTYVVAHDPLYVYCTLPIENIAGVHALEQHGFRFAECQLRCSLRLRRRFPVAGLPYSFELVEAEEDLSPILEIADETFQHDRWTTDPMMGHRQAGERFRRYVMKSLRAADEAVFRLRSLTTGDTVAFKTHRYVGNDEVLFLLAGVHPKYKNLGVGVANDHFHFNQLADKGIRRGTGHVTANNYAMINLGVGHSGFKVVAALAVLRKVYSPQATGTERS